MSFHEMIMVLGTPAQVQSARMTEAAASRGVARPRMTRGPSSLWLAAARPPTPLGPGKGGWKWNCSPGHCKDWPELGGTCIEGTIGGKAACCCPVILVNNPRQYPAGGIRMSLKKFNPVESQLVEQSSPFMPNPPPSPSKLQKCLASCLTFGPGGESNIDRTCVKECIEFEQLSGKSPRHRRRRRVAASIRRRRSNPCKTDADCKAGTQCCKGRLGSSDCCDDCTDKGCMIIQMPKPAIPGRPGDGRRPRRKVSRGRGGMIRAVASGRARNGVSVGASRGSTIAAILSGSGRSLVSVGRCGNRNAGASGCGCGGKCGCKGKRKRTTNRRRRRLR